VPIRRRKFDALPDGLDFRDRMFVPTLVEVPLRKDIYQFMRLGIPVLNQGQEGACTGFGLATVAQFLLAIRKIDPDLTPVSPRMFYEIARRYDEWPGEEYEGSSARGAMKGWHKHGVCAFEEWPYDPQKNDSELTPMRSLNALQRPLGAYFRVNHKDLVAMHAAIAEVGVLYATAGVHEGWNTVGEDGVIEYPRPPLGGHAFAVVGYDEEGLWIQNSWGRQWGMQGYGRISYDDWLANGQDVWVARLGAPIRLRTATAQATAVSSAAQQSQTYANCDLRPHIISLGNDGEPRQSGSFGNTSEGIEAQVARIPEMIGGWARPRLLLYAHGGLVPEQAAVQRVADHRATLLEHEIFPISFIWKTDFWTTIRNVLQDALRQRRPEGILDTAKDFMLDRLDDALEPIARVATGKLLWDEMKENAIRASSTARGGMRVFSAALRRLLKDVPNLELHLVAHSAGSILFAPLIQELTAIKLPRGRTGMGKTIDSLTLWAPAVTMQLFDESYLPAIQRNKVNRFTLFTLSDKAERDDHCAGIYNKSLLYLVSNALEDRVRIPVLRPEGEPLLGMQRFVEKHAKLKDLWGKEHKIILSPNDTSGASGHSTSRTHGGFDDDEPTLRATLARILNNNTGDTFDFHASGSGARARRHELMERA